MTVHIGVVIVVLIIGHILTFFLLASDISQHALTRFDRAFLWGKASQIAGWSLILAGEFALPDIFFTAGNALLFCGWGLETLAMLSLRIRVTRAHVAFYLLLVVLSLVLLPLPGLDHGLRALLLCILQTAMFAPPGAALLFSRRETSILQKTAGAIYALCCVTTLYRGVAAWTGMLDVYLPAGSTFLTLLLGTLLPPLLLLLGGMGYVLIKKEQLSRSLRIFAETDSLTGLYNRRAFFSLAGEYVLRAAEKKERFSLLMIDIDNFKRINDSYGHATGDDIIASLAATLRKSIRQTDIACRFGGEEFVVLLSGCDGREAFRIAERIRATAESSEPRSIRYTVSIGIAAEPCPDTDLDALIQLADNRMYRAKDLGRNRVLPEG